MAILLALLGLCTALAPVIIDLVRRRTAPTPEQRRDGDALDLTQAEARIAELEAAGDFAGADALRRVLNDRLTALGGPADGAAGQQLPRLAPGGDGDHGPH